MTALLYLTINIATFYDETFRLKTKELRQRASGHLVVRMLDMNIISESLKYNSLRDVLCYSANFKKVQHGCYCINYLTREQDGMANI